MMVAGVAAIQVENHRSGFTEKCGHLNCKMLVSKEEMTQKLKTIREVTPSSLTILTKKYVPSINLFFGPSNFFSDHYGRIRQ